MGPRGHRLHCTKRHFGVLTMACRKKEKTGKEILTRGLESGEVAKETFPHFLSAAKFSQWSSPVAQQETDNVSRLLTKQAKAIKTLLSLFYNMQSLTVCYSLCISPWLVSVYPLIVCLVFVVCSCAHSVLECVFVCKNEWELKAQCVTSKGSYCHDME